MCLWSQQSKNRAVFWKLHDVIAFFKVYLHLHPPEPVPINTHCNIFLQGQRGVFSEDERESTRDAVWARKTDKVGEETEGDRSTSGEKAKRGKGEEKDGKTNGLSRGKYYMRAEN